MIKRAFAFGVVAMPIIFGALRLLTTGTDARYLWTALASSLGAAVILWRPRASRAPRALHVAIAWLVAAVCATLTAFALGATSSGAIAAVAGSFGACSAAGMTLVRRARGTA